MTALWHQSYFVTGNYNDQLFDLASVTCNVPTAQSQQLSAQYDDSHVAKLQLSDFQCW